MDVNVILGFISIVVTLLCAYLGALLHRKTERIKIMEGNYLKKGTLPMRNFMISFMICLKIRRIIRLLIIEKCVIDFLKQKKN